MKFYVLKAFNRVIDVALLVSAWIEIPAVAAVVPIISSRTPRECVD